MVFVKKRMINKARFQHITRNMRLRFRLHQNCLWSQAPDGNFSYPWNVIHINFKDRDDDAKKFVKNFWRAGKNWMGSRGEKFLPASREQNCEAILCQSVSGFCSKWVRISSNKHHQYRTQRLFKIWV